LPEYLYSCEADIIIQSSDLVNFRVHKSILAFSSQFFRTMFSLPQPPTEIANELPVLPMSEDAEIVRALLTVIYPIPSEIPVAYDRVLSLLAASQKYDMPAVQSFIRTEIRLRVPATRTADEAFRAYAIASKNGLSPETSKTAYLTLDYPLTFESLGSELCLFEGWALRDLARYHKSRRDDVISCLESFFDIPIGPSKIWVGCPDRSTCSSQAGASEPSLPSWLERLFIERIFTLHSRWLRGSSPSGIIEPSSLRSRYLAALQAHAAGNETQKGCEFCLRVHACQGEEYCSELERKLGHARNKVGPAFILRTF
jgi:BTB/POZ domain